MDTIKLIRKTLLLGLLLSITILNPIHAVKIKTVPTYVKGYEISEKSSLPAIMYKDIVYIPLTYEYNKVLGIELGKDSISINTNTYDQTNWLVSYDLKNLSNQITIPNKITLFGELLNNKKLDHPVLKFRDCYYLPLTYDNLSKFDLLPYFDGKTFYANPKLGTNTSPCSGVNGIQIGDFTFNYGATNIGYINFSVGKGSTKVDLSNKITEMFEFTRVNDRYFTLINQTITTDGVSKNDKLGITISENYAYIPVTYLKDGIVHSKTLTLNLNNMSFEK